MPCPVIPDSWKKGKVEREEKKPDEDETEPPPPPPPRMGTATVFTMFEAAEDRMEVPPEMVATAASPEMTEKKKKKGER